MTDTVEAVVPVAKKQKPSDVFRILSSGALINSKTFSKLKPDKQTETLNAVAGRPVSFVADFANLRNTKDLLARLFQGEDVKQQLEFLEVEVTADDIKAFSLVQPIINRIKSLVPAYPFMELPESPNLLKLSGSESVTNGSYTVTLAKAREVWNRVNKYWGGVSKRNPDRIYLSFGSNGHHYLSSTKTAFAIGCQRFQRYQLEQLALEQGWDFPEEVAKA